MSSKDPKDGMSSTWGDVNKALNDAASRQLDNEDTLLASLRSVVGPYASEPALRLHLRLSHGKRHWAQNSYFRWATSVPGPRFDFERRPASEAERPPPGYLMHGAFQFPSLAPPPEAAVGEGGSRATESRAAAVTSLAAAAGSGRPGGAPGGHSRGEEGERGVLDREASFSDAGVSLEAVAAEDSSSIGEEGRGGVSGAEGLRLGGEAVEEGEEEEAGLACLPTAVLESILARLDHRSVCAAAMSCRAGRDAALSDFVWRGVARRTAGAALAARMEAGGGGRPWRVRFAAEFQRAQSFACPSCGDGRFVACVFGYPSPPLVAHMRAGRIHLGGDYLREDNAAWKCTSCSSSWGGFPWGGFLQGEGGAGETEPIGPNTPCPMRGGGLKGAGGGPGPSGRGGGGPGPAPGPGDRNGVVEAVSASLSELHVNGLNGVGGPALAAASGSGSALGAAGFGSASHAYGISGPAQPGLHVGAGGQVEQHWASHSASAAHASALGGLGGLDAALVAEEEEEEEE